MTIRQLLAQELKEIGHISYGMESCVALNCSLPPLQKLVVITVAAHNQQINPLSLEDICYHTMIPAEKCLALVQRMAEKGFLVKSADGTYHIGAMNLPLMEDKLPKRWGVIYAARLDSAIKIGFSDNPDSRIKSYRTSNQSVIPLFKGSREIAISDEKAFHRLHNGGGEKYSLDRESELLELLTSFDLEVA
jgi:hypothetical protein